MTKGVHLFILSTRVNAHPNVADSTVEPCSYRIHKRAEVTLSDTSDYSGLLLYEKHRAKQAFSIPFSHHVSQAHQPTGFTLPVPHEEKKLWLSFKNGICSASWCWVRAVFHQISDLGWCVALIVGLFVQWNLIIGSSDITVIFLVPALYISGGGGGSFPIQETWYNKPNRR